MIHVIATIELAPGTREAFLAAFHQIVPQVRTEVGCLEYGPTVDVATGIAGQSPPRENTVTVLEQWASVEALQAHLQAPHMLAYRSRVKDFVVGLKLQVLQPA